MSGTQNRATMPVRMVPVSRTRDVPPESEANPCVPASWREFSIDYRFGASVYLITVRRQRTGGEVVGLTVDGVDRPDRAIPLVDDGARHAVLVDLG